MTQADTLHPRDLLYFRAFPSSGVKEHLFANQLALVTSIRNHQGGAKFYRGSSESSLKGLVAQCLPKHGVAQRPVSSNLFTSVTKVVGKMLVGKDLEAFNREFEEAVENRRQSRKRQHPNDVLSPFEDLVPALRQARNMVIHANDVRLLDEGGALGAIIPCLMDPRSTVRVVFALDSLAKCRVLWNTLLNKAELHQHATQQPELIKERDALCVLFHRLNDRGHRPRLSVQQRVELDRLPTPFALVEHQDGERTFAYIGDDPGMLSWQAAEYLARGEGEEVACTLSLPKAV